MRKIRLRGQCSKKTFSRKGHIFFWKIVLLGEFYAFTDRTFDTKIQQIKITCFDNFFIPQFKPQFLSIFRRFSNFIYEK